MLPAGDSRMEWTLRLVGTGIDGQSQSFDLMPISRPDGLRRRPRMNESHEVAQLTFSREEIPTTTPAVLILVFRAIVG